MRNGNSISELHKQHNANGLICLIAFALLSVGMAFLACLLNVPAANCLRFAVFQIGIVFLTGMFGADLLLNGMELRPFSYICAVFSIGYAAVILEYIILAAIGLRDENARIIAVCTLLLLAFLVKRTQRSVIVKKWDKSEAGYTALFFVLLFIVFFAYSANYVLPNEERSSVRYHQDAMYWIETAAALKISFPPQELRFSGIQFFYHYFASVYVAYASMFTGIDTFTLGYTLYPLTRCLILFGGLYILTEVLFQKRINGILFLISVLFSTGYEYTSQSRYVSQLIMLPFGFDLALGYGASAVAALLVQIRQEKINAGLCVCAALAMLMCTGHKAPVALVFMVFAGVVCLHWLIKKEYAKAFSNGIALVVVFTLVMVFCIGFLQPGDNGVDAGKFGINANLKYTWLYGWRDQFRFAQATTIYDKLLSLGTEAVALVAMLIAFNPLMAFLDLCAVIKMLKTKQFEPVYIALLASAAFGIFMGSFNEQPGMSQMYYSLTAFIPGLALGFDSLEFSKKPLNILCTAVAMILLAFQMKWYFINEGVFDNVRSKIVAVAAHELPAIKENDSDEYAYPLYSIQYEEYEAMLWIRENTPIDAMIMPDKDVCKGAVKYLYYGTFSERQTYMEGTCYLIDSFGEQIEERRQLVAQVYLNNPDALQKVKKDGVDYIIQTKWVIPTYEGNGCSLVFENDMVRVWKID